MSEFAIQLALAPQRRDDAARWVLAHVLRNKLWMAVMLVGAFGNAAGAALMPVFVGQAFNAVTTTPVDYSVIGAAAIGIIVSQIVRSVLQLGRNFGSEIMGQPPRTGSHNDTKSGITPFRNYHVHFAGMPAAYAIVNSRRRGCNHRGIHTGGCNR